MEPLKLTFSKNLNSRMSVRKVESYRQLGKFAGIGKSTAVRLGSGKEDPNTTLDIVDAIAKALGTQSWMLLLECYNPEHPEFLPELCDKFTELSECNRSKVMTYIDDLLKAQN
jgi:hypothetical protein